MSLSQIQTSSVILLAQTPIKERYLFGAYKNNGEATSFLSLPEDHDRFVKLLTGEQTLMGRKTLEATPSDFPDAGRICITHHPAKTSSGALAVESIPQGIHLAKKRALKAGKSAIFIVGGASIIQQCLAQDLLDEIYLTLAYAHQKRVPHPVYLDFEFDNWKLKEDSGILISQHSTPKNLRYRYLRLQKNRRLS